MKVEFGLVWCSGILIFVDSATSKNIPSATFVAAKVPKVAWASRFCESSFYCFLRKCRNRLSPFSWVFNLAGICKASTSELWVFDANVGLESKLLVWAPDRNSLLDELPTDANELAAAWFTCWCCEDSELIPCELSPLESKVWMLLLRDVDPGVFIRGSFVWSVTIFKGSKSWSVAPSTDWPFNQVSSKLTYFVVAISE